MQKKAPTAYPFVLSAIEEISQTVCSHLKNCELDLDKQATLDILGLSSLDKIDVKSLNEFLKSNIDSPTKKVTQAVKKGVRGRPKKTKLDPRDLIVLHLRALGKTFAQIANVFDWSRQAVHTRHTRASKIICNLAKEKRQFVEATPILNYIKV